MKPFVVTGANKGIGLAIVKALLDSDKSALVFLGSRDSARGTDAVNNIVTQNSDAYSGRVEALEIDVSSAESVSRAADTVRSRLNGGRLRGLINNAGIALMEFSPSNFEKTVDVNFRGVVRTTEAFMPLLDASEGRIVMTSSASGPNFVARCSAERQAALIDPMVTHAQITELADECVAIVNGSGGSVAERFATQGLNEAEDMCGYGLSKALVNMYTQQLAREHPSLLINACTPGFIKTDLTKIYETQSGRNLDDMGAKETSHGAKAPVYLALGEIPSSGWYFGSDCLRSPLDRYRAPGSPAYDGK